MSVLFLDDIFLVEQTTDGYSLTVSFDGGSDIRLTVVAEIVAEPKVSCHYLIDDDTYTIVVYADKTELVRWVVDGGILH